MTILSQSQIGDKIVSIIDLYVIEVENNKIKVYKKNFVGGKRLIFDENKKGDE